MALVENLQREDLNPIEQAEAYLRLQDEFGLTQEEVARRVGRDRSSVANALRLLKLPTQVQGDLSMEPYRRGTPALSWGWSAQPIRSGRATRRSAVACRCAPPRRWFGG